jgi:predicted lipid-binding transport protein (Tim44 family)
MWAATVCEALAPWRAEISNLTRSTQEQMTAQTTPAQAQENLVRLLSGAEQASETARKKIAEAGVPDVPEGDTVSRGFLTSLTAVRDAYGKARTAVQGLGIGQAETFYDGVAAAVDTLNKEYDASGLDTSKLNSPELKQAFDEVPECR